MSRVAHPRPWLEFSDGSKCHVYPTVVNGSRVETGIEPLPFLLHVQLLTSSAVTPFAHCALVTKPLMTAAARKGGHKKAFMVGVLA